MGLSRGEKNGESRKPGRQVKADTEAEMPDRHRGSIFFPIMNIDRQDEQDERGLHEKLAWQMIRRGSTDAQDYKTPDS